MSLDRAHRATAFASHLPETAIPLSARCFYFAPMMVIQEGDSRTPYPSFVQPPPA